MSVVAIDMTKGARKTVLLTNEQMAEIEEFRFWVRAVRGRLPSESAAISELIQDGLRHWREERETEGKR
jgi:hypothetical protein